MTDTHQTDRAAVTDAVVRALETALRRDLTDVTERTRLFDEIALSSTGLLVTLVNIENLLGVRIDPETMTEEHMATLGGLVDCAIANAADR